MANSPLVVPGDADKGNSNKSKLSSSAASNGATPEAMQPSTGGHDLAEQMNEDEKQKYVKGASLYAYKLYSSS